MVDTVVDFLATHGVTPREGYLAHAARTIQDIFDEMTPEQKDAVALIVSAAIDDIDISGTDAPAVYDKLSTEQQNFVDFVVAGALTAPASMTHSAELDDFLMHFGVKGMKWGVRKGEIQGTFPDGGKSSSAPGTRKALQAKVAAGKGDLGEAHLAALKSRGHRVLNAFMGDKTYWKRTAIIAGVTALGVGAALAAPAVMPAAMLSGIGAHVAAAGGAKIAIAGHVMTSGGHLVSLVTLGKQAVTAAGVTGSLIGGKTATTVNGVSNTVRAIRGNARINKSFNAMGQQLVDNQRTASKKVQKVLNRNGSISNAALRPAT